MSGTDIKSVLKRAIELARPDFRAYYRVVRKARVVKSYASNGKYYADVQPLRNDEAPDDDEPVVPKVEIPVIWGGPNRGVVCPPAVGTYCDLSYYDGNPDYPRISNFRWHGNKAPSVVIGGFVIQQADGTRIEIDPEHNIIHVTPGNWTVNVAGNAVISAGGATTIEAPTINLVGNTVSTGAGGGAGTATETGDREQTGNFVLNGQMTVNGSISATGTVTGSNIS